MSADRRRMGRPPLAEGKAKGSLLSVRLSPDERRALEGAAGRAGEKLSEWARKRLLAAADDPPSDE